jgi:hypothetical protein
MYQVLYCFPNVAPAAGTSLCMAHWRVRKAHPQLGGLLFQLGEANQLLGHGYGTRRRAGKLQRSGGEVGLEQHRRQEGQLQEKARGGQALHDRKGGHIQHTGCRSRRGGEFSPELECGYAGMPRRLLSRDLRWRSLSWWRQTRAASARRMCRW